MTQLSVVLISKNQAWNIARLIESVLRETEYLPDKEIILVDSASTDQTTEIAATYPITILKLSSDQRLTAAAGRYVGTQQTTGDLILFLDGDMELCEGWLNQALEILHSRPDVAVVCGVVIDLPEPAPSLKFKALEALEPGERPTEVRQGGGAALYRRSVLDQVGTFNPYLYADEEPELCLRIRQAGYKVLRLSSPIVFHLNPWVNLEPARVLSTLLKKRKASFFIGYGQVIRYSLGTALLWQYFRERGWAAPPALVLGIGFIALFVSGFTGQWVWFGLWVVFLMALTLVIAIRRRNLPRALLHLFLKLLILEGTIRGFFLKPCDPIHYPGKFEKIETQWTISVTQ